MSFGLSLQPVVADSLMIHITTLFQLCRLHSFVWNVITNYNLETVGTEEAVTCFEALYCTVILTGGRTEENSGNLSEGPSVKQECQLLNRGIR
jgi:hypothetical protein